MKHVIRDFNPAGGKHCVSNALKQVFQYHGRDLSEEMIFGLASGLNFYYHELKNQPYPLIGGRTKIGRFEESLACNLGITIETHKTTSRNKAYEELKHLISRDVPVIIYVDMNPLSYLAMPEDVHFGGHAIVVFGIDEEDNVAYVSDCDIDETTSYHRVPLDEINEARASSFKPFPPKNKWLTLDLHDMWAIEHRIIYEAIRETCTVMCCAPLKNLGVKGIALFSRRVREWGDFDKRTFRKACFNAYAMIDATGGTGGGAFRRMYGNFLKESSAIIGSEELLQYGKEYLTLSELWDDIAETFLRSSQMGSHKRLEEIAEGLSLIHQKEEKLLGQLCALVREQA
jgi:hypothetical protein